MLKNILIILFIVFVAKANAQGYNQILDNIGNYPFNLRNLEKTAEVSLLNDTIKPFFIDGKFYYKNTLSNKLIATDGFDEAYPFCNGYAVVKTGYNYEIIDKFGRVIVKPIYLENGFYLDDYFPIIELGNKMFDYQTGNLTNYSFHEAELYSPQNIIYKKDGKYGVQFEDGHKTTAIYDTILSTLQMRVAVVKKNDKIGVVNRDGIAIIPIMYNDFQEGYHYHFALKKNKKWNYYNGFKLILSNRKKLVSWGQDKIIFKSGKYYGCMDEKGNNIIKANYKWISVISPIAINKKNQLVFYNKGRRDFVYYTFVN